MNRLRRIGIGALAGAVATLVIHPISRRYVLTPFLDLGPSAQLARSEWLPRNLQVLPAPADTVNASLWMQSGAEILATSRSISPKNLSRLIEVARAAALGEPENAYWQQMDTVFLWYSGRR